MEPTASERTDAARSKRNRLAFGGISRAAPYVSASLFVRQIRHRRRVAPARHRRRIDTSRPARGIGGGSGAVAECLEKRVAIAPVFADFHEEPQERRPAG